MKKIFFWAGVISVLTGMLAPVTFLCIVAGWWFLWGKDAA